MFRYHTFCIFVFAAFLLTAKKENERKAKPLFGLFPAVMASASEDLEASDPDLVHLGQVKCACNKSVHFTRL